MSSHLYKVDWNDPNISEQNHPETQTLVKYTYEGSEESASAHPDQEGRVENVLDGPGE